MTIFSFQELLIQKETFIHTNNYSLGYKVHNLYTGGSRDDYQEKLEKIQAKQNLKELIKFYQADVSRVKGKAFQDSSICTSREA